MPDLRKCMIFVCPIIFSTVLLEIANSLTVTASGCGRRHFEFGVYLEEKTWFEASEQCLQDDYRSIFYTSYRRQLQAIQTVLAQNNIQTTDLFWSGAFLEDPCGSDYKTVDRSVISSLISAKTHVAEQCTVLNYSLDSSLQYTPVNCLQKYRFVCFKLSSMQWTTYNGYQLTRGPGGTFLSVNQSVSESVCLEMCMNSSICLSYTFQNSNGKCSRLIAARDIEMTYDIEGQTAGDVHVVKDGIRANFHHATFVSLATCNRFLTTSSCYDPNVADDVCEVTTTAQMSSTPEQGTQPTTDEINMTQAANQEMNQTALNQQATQPPSTTQQQTTNIPGISQENELGVNSQTTPQQQVTSTSSSTNADEVTLSQATTTQKQTSISSTTLSVELGVTQSTTVAQPITTITSAISSSTHGVDPGLIQTTSTEHSQQPITTVTVMTQSTAGSYQTNANQPTGQNIITTTQAAVNSSTLPNISSIGSSPFSTGTTQTSSTSAPRCKCPCNVIRRTYDESFEARLKYLLIEKLKTSKSRRKRTSALDSRPSSVGIGALGVAILVVAFGLIVFNDALTIFRYWQ